MILIFARKNRDASEYSRDNDEYYTKERFRNSTPKSNEEKLSENGKYVRHISYPYTHMPLSIIYITLLDNGLGGKCHPFACLVHPS